MPDRRHRQAARSTTAAPWRPVNGWRRAALSTLAQCHRAESHDETGEAHAPAVADPLNMQAVSWCFAVDPIDGEDHIVDKPASHDFWRTHEPAAWTGPLLAFTVPVPRELSLSFLHWLQTQAQRPDGGTGYRGLRLRPDITATTDGLAMRPYIRESRRVRAEYTIVEQDVALDSRPDGRAASYAGSVGVGSTASTSIPPPVVTATSTSRAARSRSRWAPWSRSG